MLEKLPLFDTIGNAFRLSEKENKILSGHYFESLKVSMQAHDMLAVLGGKAPHNHGIFLGGGDGPAECRHHYSDEIHAEYHQSICCNK